ncbi:fumarylacetoacetate hydrolase family protein [Paraburkholderia oxyphila]|uniref:fumarylacetoacetate hydrolase family protein n=1 Tax=Paraburkholderia oxyphila TaxID=614212 RepID=UPI000483059D|nr:fumarylacetoacetate hydrolase family protein [Paraburkholderia oxyphila]
MKLLRYGPVGAELPGVLDSQGHVRALRPIVRDIDADVLSSDGIRFLQALDLEKLPLVRQVTRLGCPVATVREIIAVGLNYRDHAQEAELPIPAEPLIFHKSASSISGPDDDIVLPSGSQKTDWEIEFGIVIGTTARKISKEEAHAFIAGYVLLNDVSEREWQLERGGQFGKGKSFDTFTPIGPWLVTCDELVPQNIELLLSVNGTSKQHGNTSNLIFGVDEVVSHISQFMTLKPGDLIATGTPAGVGGGARPPRFLRAGDIVEMSATGLGSQRHKVTSGA